MKLRALVVFGLVCTACEPPTPRPPDPPPPIDRCENLAAIAVTAAPASVRTNGASAISATGGSGRYTFTIADNVSGGTLSGDRYVAGLTPGMDLIRATDDCEKTGELSVEVKPSFDVQPIRATVRYGTRFTIRVVGATGTISYAPAQAALASGGSISAAGEYTAGTREGLDLIVARDTVSGDQALLQYRVTMAARFRARPGKIAVPTGGVVPLETAEGSGVVTWRMTSNGPGT